METLYCTHCKQTYRVRPEDIALMRTHGRPVRKAQGQYRFAEGCFFKELTALKHRLRPHD